MKQLYKTLVLFYVFSSYAFAQDTTKNKPCKWGISLQVNTVDKLPPFAIFSDNNSLLGGSEFGSGDKKNNSYSLGLIINHVLKENTSLRIKVGMAKINMSNYYEHSGPTYYNNDDVSLKQTTTYIIPGIEWNIVKSKINFYTGFEIPMNIYGNYDYIRITKGDDYNYNNGMPTTAIITTIIDGGLSYGIASFAGVRIHLFKNIFIGSEFSYSLLYSKIGGSENYEEITTDDASGTILNHGVWTFRESITGYGLSGFKASLNISYLF